MSKMNRRDFLRVAINGLLGVGGALSLGGLFRFFSFETDPPRQTEFDLGPVKDFLPGTTTVLANIPAAIVRTNSGFVALSLTCTHLGCTVEHLGDAFECPCHGSRYNQSGEIVRGPANKSLRRLCVEETPEGNLKLFTA